MVYHHPERRAVFRELLALVQEKDSQGDEIAALVLIWAFRRLVENSANLDMKEED